MIVALFVVSAVATTIAPTDDDRSQEIAAVEALRMLDPEDPVALERLAALLGEQGDLDAELAYLLSAQDAYDRTETDDARAKAKQLKAIVRRIGKIDPASAGIHRAVNRYASDLREVVQLYGINQKKARNALEVGAQILRYRPENQWVGDLLDRILKDGTSEVRLEAQRLLNYRDLQRPRRFRVDWAREHRDWNRAGRVQTKGYSVRSNIGYDTLHRSAGLLEQMARFYRRFYAVTEDVQQGKTQVNLYRTRKQYDDDTSHLTPPDPSRKAFIYVEKEGRPDSRGGFESVTAMRFQLFSYDSREDGRPLESMYSFLFHEASHQYMALAVGGNEPPPWLDEGMACYFEGARLGALGEVEIGLPARERLDRLHAILQAGVRPLEAALMANPLPGMYYYTAWGLIYYLYHATSEESLTNPYRDRIHQLVKAAGQRPYRGLDLFEEVILKPSGLSFSEFEEQWVQFILELHTREQDPVAAAAFHLQRGEHCLAEQAPQSAREAFADTLLRDPGNVAALLGLARVAALKDGKEGEDAALLFARRAYRSAELRSDEEGMSRARKVAESVDKGGFKRLLRARQKYQQDIQRQIQRHLQEGRPRTALALTRRLLDGVLGTDRFVSLSRKLRKQGDLDLQRTTQVFDGATLEGLSASPSVFKIVDEQLVGGGPRPGRAPLFLAENCAAQFRLQGEIQLQDANTIVLFLMADPRRMTTQGFAVRGARDGTPKPRNQYLPFDRLEPSYCARVVHEFHPEMGFTDFVLDSYKSAAHAPPAGTWVPFLLNRTNPESLTLELNGVEIDTLSLDSDSPEVLPGLLFYGGEVRLRELQIIELDRL
jgi:hypothetical protein